MRSIAFGTLRFDRRSIPAELADLSQWPSADDSALDEQARGLFARRVQAMTLFVDRSTPLQAIGRETGVRINDLYRLFDRCIAPHEDGRIYGCRALLPWLHTRRYERRARVTTTGTDGTSGAFGSAAASIPGNRALDRA
jgi:putative transposase